MSSQSPRTNAGCTGTREPSPPTKRPKAAPKWLGEKARRLLAVLPKYFGAKARLTTRKLRCVRELASERVRRKGRRRKGVMTRCRLPFLHHRKSIGCNGRLCAVSLSLSLPFPPTRTRTNSPLHLSIPPTLYIVCFISPHTSMHTRMHSYIIHTNVLTRTDGAGLRRGQRRAQARVRGRRGGVCVARGAGDGAAAE